MPITVKANLSEACALVVLPPAYFILFYYYYFMSVLSYILILTTKFATNKKNTNILKFISHVKYWFEWNDYIIYI
jgi:hypothetical protein